MSLPADEAELRKRVEFVILRWQLEHDHLAVSIQAHCLGMPISRDDYFKIIRAYVDQRDEVRDPKPGEVIW